MAWNPTTASHEKHLIKHKKYFQSRKKKDKHEDVRFFTSGPFLFYMVWQTLVKSFKHHSEQKLGIFDYYNGMRRNDALNKYAI